MNDRFMDNYLIHLDTARCLIRTWVLNQGLVEICGSRFTPLRQRSFGGVTKNSGLSSSLQQNHALWRHWAIWGVNSCLGLDIEAQVWQCFSRLVCVMFCNTHCYTQELFYIDVEQRHRTFQLAVWVLAFMLSELASIHCHGLIELGDGLQQIRKNLN